MGAFASSTEKRTPAASSIQPNGKCSRSPPASHLPQPTCWLWYTRRKNAIYTSRSTRQSQKRAARNVMKASVQHNSHLYQPRAKRGATQKKSGGLCTQQTKRAGNARCVALLHIVVSGRLACETVRPAVLYSPFRLYPFDPPAMRTESTIVALPVTALGPPGSLFLSSLETGQSDQPTTTTPHPLKRLARMT